MSITWGEIASQPAAWRRAAALATEVRDLLPAPGLSVCAVGCGTSLYMAQAWAALRESAGHGRTDAFAASELPARSGYDVLVAISRSGTTSEVLHALGRGLAARSLTITAVAGSPAAEAADAAIVLDFADERSVVQTVFATTTLMLLRASLGESVDAAVAQAREVLDGQHRAAPALVSVEQISFLGRHWAYGIAQEAALKLREACRLWTESYPQMEYRHGPIAIAQAGRAVWVMGDPVPGLVEDIRRTGALLVDDDLDPVVDLIRAQLLAVERAEAAGLDPDRPRSLARSVVLADS
jgi:fructoselysine-6-P-deglycase FrlB-like protein